MYRYKSYMRGQLTGIPFKWTWQRRLLLCTLLLFSFCACSSDTDCGNQSAVTGKPTFTISPKDITLLPGGQTTFHLSRNTELSVTITWDVVDAHNNHDPSGGSVDQSGNYTAPNSAVEAMVRVAGLDKLGNVAEADVASVHVVTNQGQASVTVK